MYKRSLTNDELVVVHLNRKILHSYVYESRMCFKLKVDLPIVQVPVFSNCQIHSISDIWPVVLSDKN